MKPLKKFTAIAAALSISVLTMALPAHAKNFKIAVGDSGGSTQEVGGLAFKKSLEELSGGKHTATGRMQNPPY